MVPSGPSNHENAFDGNLMGFSCVYDINSKGIQIYASSPVLLCDPYTESVSN